MVVLDFGGLKEVKKWLEDTFDHKTLIAEDDPLLQQFMDLHAVGGCDLIVVKNMGIEAFTKIIWDRVAEWLEGPNQNAKLVRVEVSEHDGNLAYIREADNA